MSEFLESVPPILPLLPANIPKRQQMMAQVIESLTPTWPLKWSAWLLAWAWHSPCCSQGQRVPEFTLESESVGGR